MEYSAAICIGGPYVSDTFSALIGVFWNICFIYPCSGTLLFIIVKLNSFFQVQIQSKDSPFNRQKMNN